MSLRTINTLPSCSMICICNNSTVRTISGFSWKPVTDSQLRYITITQSSVRYELKLITRHSHRHSLRRAQGLSHMTMKAKVVLALFYQNSYVLSNGQNALNNSKNGLSYGQSYIFHVL